MPLIYLWTLLVRRALRDAGRHPALALAADLLAALVALAVYRYTSEAIGPALQFSGDYFAFVVVGEMALQVPLVLWNGVAATVRSTARDGSLELWTVSPLGPTGGVALQSLASLPREIFRVALTLGLAWALGWRFGVAGLGLLWGVAWGAVPLFLGLGALAAAGLVLLRRGNGVIAHIGTVSTLLAGAYFPRSVLPDYLTTVAALSPFTWVLDLGRQAAQGSVPVGAFGALLVGGGLVCLLGLAALEGAFRVARHWGEPFLFSE